MDDATGIVANAVFRPQEDTRGYFMLMRGLIERWGIPIALYGDRHGVFKFSGKPRHIHPPVEATHFSRALVELGIQQIFARSPQAKGRVERMAGTFQDRLVTELRLAGAKTMDQANAVLHAGLPAPLQRSFCRARRFCRLRPTVPGISSAPWTKSCASSTSAKVAKDHTVKYQWRTLQLLPSAERPSYAGVHVEVLEHTDARLQVRYDGDIIPSKPAPPRPGVLRASHGALAPTPELRGIVKRLGNHRLSQSQLRRLANLEPDPIADDERIGRQRRQRTATPSLPGTHTSPAGAVEGGATRQGTGPSYARDRTAAGHLSQHRTQVRPCSHSAHEPASQSGHCTSIQTDRRTLGLTKSLSI